MRRSAWALPVLLVALCFAAPALGAPAGRGIVSGQILRSDGSPLSEGLVFFYDSATGPVPRYQSYWRIPDFYAYLDEIGQFFRDVPAGSYYLGAIQRRSGGTRIGPPEEGDLVLVSADPGGAKTYRIEAGARVNLGQLRGAEPFQSGPPRPGETAIEGTVTEESGKPVPGALVYAFTTPRVTGKPQFVSKRSDAAGHFRLPVAQGGVYYLKVRSVYGGGAPGQHEIVDSYGKDALHALAKVVVEKGATAQVHLTALYTPTRGRKAPSDRPLDPRRPAEP